MTFKKSEIEQTYEAQTPIAPAAEVYDGFEAYEPGESCELASAAPVNDSFLGLLSNCPSMHANEIDGKKWTDVTQQVMQSISDRVFSSPQAARQMRARSIECRYRRDDDKR